MHDYDEIFKRSFARAVGNGSYNRDFIGRFYDVFMSQSEEVSDLFKSTNMSAQKTMLHDSLQHMADFYSSRRTNEYMQHIAKIHSQSGLDIPERLYSQWLDSLLQAVSEFDPQYDESVELSWRLVLSPGITYMNFMRDKL